MAVEITEWIKSSNTKEPFVGLAVEEAKCFLYAGIQLD